MMKNRRLDKILEKTIYAVTIAFYVLLIKYGCDYYWRQPIPKCPVTYRGAPRNIVEVKGKWKMGEFTCGYRIEFDSCYAISDGGGLLGQEGMPFVGPGMVPHKTIQTFERVADICNKILNKDSITIYGDLAKDYNNKDLIYLNKRVILLYEAYINQDTIKINRVPIEN